MQTVPLETILNTAEERGLQSIRDRVITALLDDDSEKREVAQNCLRYMGCGTIKQGSIREGRMILEIEAGNGQCYVDVGQVPQEYERSKGYPFTLTNGQ